MAKVQRTGKPFPLSQAIAQYKALAGEYTLTAKFTGLTACPGQS